MECSDLIFGFYDTFPLKAKLWSAVRKFEWCIFQSHLCHLFQCLGGKNLCTMHIQCTRDKVANVPSFPKLEWSFIYQPAFAEHTGPASHCTRKIEIKIQAGPFPQCWLNTVPICPCDVFLFSSESGGPCFKSTLPLTDWELGLDLLLG